MIMMSMRKMMAVVMMIVMRIMMSMMMIMIQFGDVRASAIDSIILSIFIDIPLFLSIFQNNNEWSTATHKRLLR